MTLLFAATYPDRTPALILTDPFARVTEASDYPLGRPVDQLTKDLERLRSVWGTHGGLRAGQTLFSTTFSPVFLVTSDNTRSQGG
jgi:hypothetical protein